MRCFFSRTDREDGLILMSQMKAFIHRLVENQKTVLVFVPGKGYVYARVDSLDDDLVTLNPEKDERIIMHYTQFSMKAD